MKGLLDECSEWLGLLYRRYNGGWLNWGIDFDLLILMKAVLIIIIVPELLIVHIT